MNRSRAGGGFVKFLAAVAALALIAVLAWGVYANWNRDRDGDGTGDGADLDVTRPEWWSASKDKAQPWIDYSFEKAAALKDDIWGEGGVIDDAEAWFEARKKQDMPPAAAPTPAPAPTPTAPPPAASPASSSPAPMAAPAKPAKSPATLRQEERIRTAAELMQDGLRHYRAGIPADHGWTDASVRELNEAKTCFTRVRDILSNSPLLSEYAAAPDHDPRLLADAREMELRNKNLLISVVKMGSAE